MHSHPGTKCSHQGGNGRRPFPSGWPFDTTYANLSFQRSLSTVTHPQHFFLPSPLLSFLTSSLSFSFYSLAPSFFPLSKPSQPPRCLKGLALNATSCADYATSDPNSGRDRGAKTSIPIIQLRACSSLQLHNSPPPCPCPSPADRERAQSASPHALKAYLTCGTLCLVIVTKARSVFQHPGPSVIILHGHLADCAQCPTFYRRGHYPGDPP